MNDKEFGDTFRKKVQELNMEHKDIMRELMISRLTFDRWMAGESSPHEIGQQAVFGVLDNLNQ